MGYKKTDFDGKVVNRTVDAEGRIHAYDKNDRMCFDNSHRQRVVLDQDLRAAHAGCYAGLLGWIVPSELDGYKWARVQFDDGQTIDVRTYALQRVEPDRAEVIARVILDANRGTIGDADPDKAYAAKLALWREHWSKRVDFERVVEYGAGRDELYAFTFRTLQRVAELEGRDSFPIKVGYTTRERMNSVSRIVTMTALVSFPEPALLLLTWRTDNGRKFESAVHAELDARGRRIIDAPGSEWFQSNISEVVAICESLSRRNG